MTTRTGIAERIALQAKEKFKNQSAFAQAAGMTQGAISHYYAGKRVPSAEMIPAISRALGVSMEYLLTGEGPSVTDANAEEWKTRALAAEAKLAQLSALLGIETDMKRGVKGILPIAKNGMPDCSADVDSTIADSAPINHQLKHMKLPKLPR